MRELILDFRIMLPWIPIPVCVWLVQPENIFVKNGVFKIGDMGLVTVIKGSPREVDD